MPSFGEKLGFFSTKLVAVFYEIFHNIASIMNAKLVNFGKKLASFGKKLDMISNKYLDTVNRLIG